MWKPPGVSGCLHSLSARGLWESFAGGVPAQEQDILSQMPSELPRLKMLLLGLREFSLTQAFFHYRFLFLFLPCQ